MDPTAERHYNRGEEAFLEKDFERALQAFTRATELNPFYAEAWFRKGVTLGELDRNEEALRAYASDRTEA
jgi:Flp pilus assembly protein TadD